MNQNLWSRYSQRTKYEIIVWNDKWKIKINSDKCQTFKFSNKMTSSEKVGIKTQGKLTAKQLRVKYDKKTI